MKTYIVRVPIFNAKQEVVAYELLFQDDVKLLLARMDGETLNEPETPKQLTNTLTLFGLDVLTQGKQAFISMTGDILGEESITVFEPSQLVIQLEGEILGNMLAVQACYALKEKGYTLVASGPGSLKDQFQLVELSDIIKVDFLKQEHATHEEDVKSLLDQNKVLLASGLDSHEDFKWATQNGYELFQGNFFATPDVLYRKEIRGARINALQLMQEIQKPELDIKALEPIIKNDVSLSYRLLRYINSAFFAWRVEIRSIKQAIVLLGEREFKKWASLIAMSGLSDEKPGELLITALVRARFFELMAPHLKMDKDKNDLFLLGLFSVLDAVMDRPFDEILAEIPLNTKVANALMGEPSPYLNLLTGMKCFEKGDWDGFMNTVEGQDVSDDVVPDTYLTAVEWANQSMNELPKKTS